MDETQIYTDSLWSDHESLTSRRVGDSCHSIATRDSRGDAATAFQLLPAIPLFPETYFASPIATPVS